MSANPHFRAEVMVAAPVEEVWSFFQTAQNLASMTPPDQKLRIGEGGDVPLYAGLEVRISVSPMLGIRTGWLTRIEEVHPPETTAGQPWFRDTQLSGPFSLWNHRHAFIPVHGGCRVVDELEYRVPLGALGQAVAGRWVRRQMETLFAFREEQLIARFGRLSMGE